MCNHCSLKERQEGIKPVTCTIWSLHGQWARTYEPQVFSTSNNCWHSVVSPDNPDGTPFSSSESPFVYKMSQFPINCDKCFVNFLVSFSKILFIHVAFVYIFNAGVLLSSIFVFWPVCVASIGTTFLLPILPSTSITIPMIFRRPKYFYFLSVSSWTSLTSTMTLACLPASASISAIVLST